MKIKIKDIQGKYGTSKYQLLDPDAKTKGKASNRERGYRPLEAGEIVEVDDKDGEAFIRSSNGLLEMTIDEPTRPLYFEGEGQARLTSAKYNIDSPEREEAQAIAKASVKEKLNEGNAK